MQFSIRVCVLPKEGVLDPQGEAVKAALIANEFSGIDDVRQGRLFDITLEADNLHEARARAEKMAERLLANMIIERYEIKSSE